MDSTALAWAGWGMRIPVAWHPLSLRGRRDGLMLVGDGRAAHLQVKWKRGTPVARPLRWMEKSARQALRTATAHETQLPPGFDAAYFASNEPSLSDSNKLVWYGSSDARQLVLELVYNGAAEPGATRIFTKLILPSLRAGSSDGYTSWALYQAEFASPPGFQLVEQRLVSGDISLKLMGDLKSRLLLRQVYPATLALSRKNLEAWLAQQPFKRLGRILENHVTEAKTYGALPGLSRKGVRRIPPPLSFLYRRHVNEGIAHDSSRNRLLIVSQESAAPIDDSSIETLLQRMLPAAA